MRQAQLNPNAPPTPPSSANPKQLFCSSDAGVGIVAANSDGAESVVAKARIVLSKAAMEKCASMP